VGEQASLALHTTGLLEAERAAVDRLTDLDRLKSTFVAAVSHELRTPLTAILGFSELLAEEIDDPRLSHYLDDLRRESAVLEALIGNLLDTSRLEAGMLRLNVHPIDLTATIDQAIDVVAHAHPGRTIRRHLPEGSRPIAADGVRLRQVFINLVENAAKYSPEGTVIDVTVWDDEARNSGRVDITVDDEGPGIPAEERARVFERFRRLAGHEARPGTGIGLYVVKALVEAHGGSVVVEDGPQGWGTRFRVSLPIQLESA
jgi:two-component system sensor histidine kinase KdpD